ncbi:MAG: hypothetical protein HY898_01535 [Deltaproteobacteria bacterium]|nr:hypothetical protein [Deltaproteobacteria bacterium]
MANRGFAVGRALVIATAAPGGYDRVMGNDELDQSLIAYFAWRTADDILAQHYVRAFEAHQEATARRAEAEQAFADMSSELLHLAIRTRKFSTRARAIEELSRRGELTYDDLEFITRDMIVHPLPEFDEDAEDLEGAYRCETMSWLTQNRPADLAPLLEQLFGVASRQGFDKDAAWALEALAAIAPDRAVDRIDSWLASSSSTRRVQALCAVEHLPLKLAEPRVRSAVCDPAWRVRLDAFLCWDRMAGESLELNELTGVNLELLREPPSRTFLARLPSIRRKRNRHALAAQLLAEAPDREAVCLLIVALQDDTFLQDLPLTDLPQSREEWAETLAIRFGDAGVEAVCALARTGSPEDEFQWCDTVVAAIGQLDEATAQTWIWRLLLSGSLPGQANALGDLLELMAPSEALDATLAEQFAVAIGTGEYRLASALVHAGVRRGIEAVMDRAQRMLDREPTEDTFQLQIDCAKALESVGRLDDAWLVSAMSDPGAQAFKVLLAGTVGKLTGAGRRVLERQLASTDFEMAVLAAMLLIDRDPSEVTNPRIREIHDQAAPEQSIDLTYDLLKAGHPPAELLPHVEPLFDSDDEEVAEPLQSIVDFLLEHRPDGDEWLERIASRTPLAVVSGAIESGLHSSDHDVDFWEEEEWAR